MQNQPFFVSVATVAANLEELRRIAGDLLLAAINARIIALRAGSEAAGFQPITDFIDQKARATADLGDAIESGTHSASQLAVGDRRATKALHLLRRAAVFAGTDGVSLQAVIDRCNTEQTAVRVSLGHSVEVVDDLLAQIGKCMRSISVITVQSRVEAQQAGAYRDDLEAVAASMSSAAEQVSVIVRQSRRELRNALAVRAKQGITD